MSTTATKAYVPQDIDGVRAIYMAWRLGVEIQVSSVYTDGAWADHRKWNPPEKPSPDYDVYAIQAIMYSEKEAEKWLVGKEFKYRIKPKNHKASPHK